MLSNSGTKQTNKQTINKYINTIFEIQLQAAINGPSTTEASNLAKHQITKKLIAMMKMKLSGIDGGEEIWH